jgi:hypothetical protein
VAETFAAGFADRRRFRGDNDGEARAWLYGIARHRLTDYLRRGTVERRALQRIGFQWRPLSEAEYERIEELAGLGEVRGAIGDALSELSDEHRCAATAGRGGAVLQAGRAQARRQRADRPGARQSRAVSNASSTGRAGPAGGAMSTPSELDETRLPILDEVGADLGDLFRAQEARERRFRARLPMRFRLRARVLLPIAALLVVAGAATAAVKLASGPKPIHAGKFTQCPPDHDYMASTKTGLVVPPNYPTYKGAGITSWSVVRCFSSEQQAVRPGYKVPGLRRSGRPILRPSSI